MNDDRDFHDLPRIDGGGSCHTLTDRGERIFGEPGARIKVRPVARRIGFHLPPKPIPPGAAQ
jgi:hypothetical protein